MATFVSLKRLTFAVFLTLAAAALFVPGASAGNFDEQRMGCAGEDPATCAEGTTFQPYELKLYLLGDEDLPCAVFTVASGTFPPGLVMSSDEARIHGTPTQAGTYDFYLDVTYNRETSCQFKNPSQDRFIIPIKPGVPPKPKLTIGPESTTPGTVGTAYSLPMTANLSDAKTWSINSGTLPPGLTLGAGDGLISGTPLTRGSYTFTVLAAIDPQTTDTKTLTIDIRDRLVITPPEEFDLRRIARTEVGLSFLASLSASGGFGEYEWSSADLPTDFTLDPDGTLSGEPTEAGSYLFTATVTDEEGRVANYRGRIIVAERLLVLPRRLTGRVGLRLRGGKVLHEGGVIPLTRRVKKGPLPRGIFFNPTTGVFFGTPTKPGTWRVGLEYVDELGVKAKATITIVIAPALKR